MDSTLARFKIVYLPFVNYNRDFGWFMNSITVFLSLVTKQMITHKMGMRLYFPNTQLYGTGNTQPPVQKRAMCTEKNIPKRFYHLMRRKLFQ